MDTFYFNLHMTVLNVSPRNAIYDKSFMKFVVQDNTTDLRSVIYML